MCFSIFSELTFSAVPWWNIHNYKWFVRGQTDQNNTFTQRKQYQQQHKNVTGYLSDRLFYEPYETWVELHSRNPNTVNNQIAKQAVIDWYIAPRPAKQLVKPFRASDFNIHRQLLGFCYIHSCSIIGIGRRLDTHDGIHRQLYVTGSVFGGHQYVFSKCFWETVRR